jgi:MFS family permease
LSDPKTEPNSSRSPEESSARPPEPAPASRPRSPFAAFASRDFRFYLAARFLATVAVQMLSVAVGFQVYSITHRALDLGYVGLAQFLPVMGLSLLAGNVVDRFDRRRVLLLCDLVFALCAGLLFLLSRAESPSLPLLFATLLLFGAARAFYGPAGTALMPSLLPREHFPNAVTWQSTSWEIAAIGGPSLGGLVYGLGGPRTVYLGAAVLLACACLLVARIETHTSTLERRPPSLATAFAGLRYVWANKILLGSISLDFFAVFLGGAVALLPVYATDVLHVGPSGLGLMRSAPAVGAGLTAAFLAFRPLGRHAGAKMLVGVAIFGAATIVFGLSRSFPLSLFALALLGAADMVSVVVRMTLEQLATPPEMRGRVSAVNMVFVGASNELGEFESGTLAALIGATPAVVSGGVGTLVVVTLWAWLFPAIRRVDRLEDVGAK